MTINAILFGASGMIGKGVLLECLEHPNVSKILAIGRRSCGVKHPKLNEIIHTDFLSYSTIEEKLSDFNACFFCLGVPSSGMTEQDYHLITHDYVVKAAEVLSVKNKDMTFCFISGAGTDEKGKSRMMWARVKGKAENSLKLLPFKNLYLFRPAFVHPKKEIKPSYSFYKIMVPFYPLLRFLFPKYVSNTVEVGQAMINAVVYGVDRQVLESKDIIQLAKRGIEFKDRI
ncbi:epimerase [Candidatus Latescibacterota bacterium]